MAGLRGSRPSLYRPGTVICGRYKIVERRGYGGTAEVYEAEDLRLFTHVALKIAHPELATHPEALKRMTSMMNIEARIGAQLRSRAGRPGADSIVVVLDVGCTDDEHRLPFFAMDLLDGHTLFERIEQRRKSRAPFDVVYVLRFALDLIKVLILLHEHQIIHCDLKPDNLFFHRGGAEPVLKLLDLGLMQWAGNPDPVEGFRGTMRYASPEQILLQPLTFASDVYSVGIILFEVITLQWPYDRPGAQAMAGAELREAHLRGTPASMSELRADIPPELQTTVLTMLDKEPSRRPALLDVGQTFLDLLDHLLIAKGIQPATDLRKLFTREVNSNATTQPIPKPILVHTRPGGSSQPVVRGTVTPSRSAPSGGSSSSSPPSIVIAPRVRRSATGAQATSASVAVAREPETIGGEEAVPAVEEREARGSSVVPTSPRGDPRERQAEPSRPETPVFPNTTDEMPAFVPWASTGVEAEDPGLRAALLNRTEPDPLPPLFDVAPVSIASPVPPQEAPREPGRAGSESASLSSSAQPGLRSSKPLARPRAEVMDGTVWVESPIARSHEDPRPPKVPVVSVIRARAVSQPPPRRAGTTPFPRPAAGSRPSVSESRRNQRILPLAAFGILMGSALAAGAPWLRTWIAHVGLPARTLAPVANASADPPAAAAPVAPLPLLDVPDVIDAEPRADP